MKKRLAFPLAGLAMAIASSAAMGAEYSVESVDVLVGSTEATVGWSFLNSAENITDFTVDITYDPALLTAQTTLTELFPGFFLEAVDGCLDGLPSVADAGCVLNAPGEIRMSFSNLPSPIPDFTTGTITFDLDPSFADGDSEDITAALADVLPGDAVVTMTSGSISFQDAPPAVFGVDPASIDFGNVRVGETSDERPIEICNDAAPGSSSLTISDITTAPAQFAEGAGSTCAATSFGLAAGECCNYHVTFSPNAEDSFTGSVAIQGNVASVSVALSGEGTVSDANLTIAPTSADFGTLDINDPAVTRDFTLQNAGSNDPLDITSTSVQAVMLRGMMVTPFDIVADTCEGQTLAPQADCLITVAFDPSDAGTFNSTLAVSSSANNVNADLTGVGTATADIVVDPPFGPVSLGFGEAGETVTRNGTVTNNGSASADVSCTLDDTTGVFSTTPSPLSATFDAGSTADFSLSCALPADGEEGDTYSATLTCSVDNDVAGTHDLSCGVTEFEPLPVPTMSNWSIALFALLMLLVGGISIRFFRT